MPGTERREHRRLEIRLPLEYRPAAEGACAYRTVTLNVSTGGLYFETDSQDIGPGTLLELELTVPPGDGHFPYVSRVSSVAEVLRARPLAREVSARPGGQRLGVAARFREPLKLSY